MPREGRREGGQESLPGRRVAMSRCISLSGGRAADGDDNHEDTRTARQEECRQPGRPWKPVHPTPLVGGAGVSVILGVG